MRSQHCFYISQSQINQQWAVVVLQYVGRNYPFEEKRSGRENEKMLPRRCESSFCLQIFHGGNLRVNCGSHPSHKPGRINAHCRILFADTCSQEKVHCTRQRVFPCSVNKRHRVTETFSILPSHTLWYARNRSSSKRIGDDFRGGRIAKWKQKARLLCLSD